MTTGAISTCVVRCMRFSPLKNRFPIEICVFSLHNVVSCIIRQFFHMNVTNSMQTSDIALLTQRRIQPYVSCVGASARRQQLVGSESKARTTKPDGTVFVRLTRNGRVAVAFAFFWSPKQHYLRCLRSLKAVNRLRLSKCLCNLSLVRDKFRRESKLDGRLHPNGASKRPADRLRKARFHV